MIYSISNHDLQQFWNKIFTSIPPKVDTIHKRLTKKGKISKLWGAWQRLESLTSDLRPLALAPPHGLGASCARAGKRCQGGIGNGEQGGTQAFALSGNSDWRSGTNIKETVGSTSTCRAKTTTFNWNDSAILLVLGLLKPLHKGKRPQASC